MAGAAETTILTRSDAETADAGRRLAGTLKAGDIVILTGTLGAGKTVFVRGLAEGLGIDAREVHSPSFTIVSQHGPGAAGLLLIHADLYRVDDPAEIEDLGLTDYLGRDGVVAVEWGEKLPRRLKAGAVHVTLEDAGDDLRRITIERS